MKKFSQLRKIPVGPFIEILKNLYDDGVDFIDINGETSEDLKNIQDTITIIIRPGYNIDDPEYDHDENKQDCDNLNINMMLLDEDINDLI